MFKIIAKFIPEGKLLYGPNQNDFLRKKIFKMFD